MFPKLIITVERLPDMCLPTARLCVPSAEQRHQVKHKHEEGGNQDTLQNAFRVHPAGLFPSDRLQDMGYARLSVIGSILSSQTLARKKSTRKRCQINSNTSGKCHIFLTDCPE